MTKPRAMRLARRACLPGIALVAAVAGLGCSPAPSVVNLYYRAGSYPRQVAPVRVGVYYAQDQRPGWPRTAGMRIYGGLNGSPEIWHTEGDKDVGMYVGRALRMELSATGMQVSTSPAFNRSSAGVDGSSLRNAGVDRVVLARVNYLGVAGPEPEARDPNRAVLAAPVGGGLLGALIVGAAAGAMGYGQSWSGGDGVVFDHDIPMAQAYVDLDLWVVEPATGRIVWADSVRSKRPMGILRGVVAGRVETFLADTVYLALHGAIWRDSFLGAMGTRMLSAKASLEKVPTFEQQGKKLFAAGKFVDAAFEFKKAYEASKSPIYLFSMAVCYRQAKNPKLALWAYQEYLVKDPHSMQTSVVEERIRELKAELGEE